MKREFSKLGTEASIKNTLPVDELNPYRNNQTVVPYRSRTGTVVVGAQEEFDFEVSSSGKAIYYMKQERENLKTQNLYEDREPEPPVEKQYIYEKGEDSDVDFDLYYHHDGDDDLVEEGTNLEFGKRYDVNAHGDFDHYDFYLNGIIVVEDDSSYGFYLAEDMSVNNKVVITVKRHQETHIITVVNHSSSQIEIHGDGDTVFVAPGQTNYYDLAWPGDEVRIIHDSSNDISASITGTYKGVDYDNTTLKVSSRGICNPYNNMEYWSNFNTDDSSVITVENN